MPTKTLQINLPLTVTPIHGWAYEHALAAKFFHKIHYDEGVQIGNYVHSLHREICALFQRVGRRKDGSAIPCERDNKQTFCVLMSEVGRVYLTFHDGNLYMGTEVRPYHGLGLADPDYEPIKE